MRNGIGWFSVIGAERAMREIGAERLLELVGARLSFDQLIVMLKRANAPNELIQSMDAPPAAWLLASVALGDMTMMVQMLDNDATSSNPIDISSLLAHAVGSGQANAVALLLRRGANIFGVGDGVSLLTTALATKNIEIIQLLVDAGAKLSVEEQNQAPLLVAAGIDACRVLLNASAPPQLIQKCLEHALSSGDAETVELCLSLGAAPTQTEHVRAISSLGYIVSSVSRTRHNRRQSADCGSQIGAAQRRVRFVAD